MLKKITSKKYFHIILFSVLLLVFAVLLHTTISQDLENNTPEDNTITVDATVTDLIVYTTKDESGVLNQHYNVGVYIKISDDEIYENYYLYDVPETDIGDVIKVKYDIREAGVFTYDYKQDEHYRITLYVLYSALIIFCIGAMIFSSRFIEYIEFRKERDRKIAERKALNAAEGSEEYDPTESASSLDPFADKNTDYNAIYEYDQKMNDASYSAEGTYSGYDEQAADNTYNSAGQYDDANNSAAAGTYSSAGISNNPMDAQYDPFAPYSGYEEPNHNIIDNSNTSADTYSSAGGSNNSMDAQYDPFAPYSGYEEPNHNIIDNSNTSADTYSSAGGSNNSMDAQYDPFKPYSGYEE